MAVPVSKVVSFPSTTRSYSTIGEMEGRPLQDDMIALAKVHNLGEKNGGWSDLDVAAYLINTLAALRSVSSDRRRERG